MIHKILTGVANVKVTNFFNFVTSTTRGLKSIWRGKEVYENPHHSGQTEPTTIATTILKSNVTDRISSHLAITLATSRLSLAVEYPKAMREAI
ncbi:hypothetical protein Y032_0100g3267 [Ancylostoma ceylanicum]|uniref:Uncharacterized protein n=1 Tax=Ancylostoma ceylanicum TaxID=53326 RepID=A0A016THC3_9BILA|nr:hypothetical protein Y032_0100g3267 [Ancylostoma ceylanicum]